MKYSFEKKNDGGKPAYRYTGTNKAGESYTGKWYSTEQSARADVRKNLKRVRSKKNPTKGPAKKGLLESRGYY